MKISKVIISFIMAGVFMLISIFPICALEIKEPTIEMNVKSAILMDANTGTVLYSYNEDERLAPASVTKIMTLLLVFEAIDDGKLKYDDILTVSENASSMGGSQIFLEPGENMSVNDLLKSVIMASANDAAVTLAEHVCGSEEAFVERMNERAKELGMENTSFENATGLDDDTKAHLTSAKDIAIMSMELLKHEKVMDYTTIWMDTVRNGEFGLTNTNRLIRFYRGITGLKTGYTSEAGFCISATAKRDGMNLIAVIMGAESSDQRNACAAKLLDYGFANYSVYKNSESGAGKVRVLGGVSDYVNAKYDNLELLINKGDNNKISYKLELKESMCAPIQKGDVCGEVIYYLNGKELLRQDIYCTSSVEKITLIDYLIRIFKKIF